MDGTQQGHVACRLMSAYRSQTVAVCEAILMTLEHGITALIQNKPQTRSSQVLHVIPRSLLVLQAQMQLYWDWFVGS